MKKIWKYLLLLTVASFIAMFFYCSITLALEGNQKAPKWFVVWLSITILCMATSLILGILSDIKSLKEGIKGFLN